jgi:heme exporter protein B
LFAKELRIAFRGKVLVGVGVGMALVLSATLGFSLANVKLSLGTISALIWIVALFSSSEPLLRAFINEEERGTADQIRLRVPFQIVFISKFVSGALFVAIVSLVSTFLIALWMGVDISKLPVLLLVVVLGCPAIASVQAVIGYLLAKGNTGGAIYPVVMFPILLPMLVALIAITTDILESNSVSLNYVLIAGAETLAMILAGVFILPSAEEGL